jgi:starch-binding outer membrane protein, SusD/RagB family
MKNLKLKLIGFSLLGLLFTSCVDELDTKPVVELSLELLLAQVPQAI